MLQFFYGMTAVLLTTTLPVMPEQGAKKFEEFWMLFRVADLPLVQWKRCQELTRPVGER